MQRMEKGTRVLALGLNQDEWQNEHSGLIKGGLQTMDMAWSFTSWAVLTVEEAVEIIKKYEDLELVTICAGDDVRYSDGEMLCLAAALHAHLHKPWIHVNSPETGNLFSTFNMEGLTIVHGGSIEHAIFERWRSQTSK